MEVDEFIEAAIAEGMRDGVGSLSPEKRVVFLISEAEVLCDMEGIDSFLRQYSPAWTNETAAAYSHVGATDIAEGFREIGSAPVPSEQLLDRVLTMHSSGLRNWLFAQSKLSCRSRLMRR